MVLELDGEREGRARNYSLHIITKYYPVKHSSQPGLISNLFFPRRGRKEAHRGRNEGKEIHQARWGSRWLMTMQAALKGGWYQERVQFSWYLVFSSSPLTCSRASARILSAAAAASQERRYFIYWLVQCRVNNTTSTDMVQAALGIFFSLFCWSWTNSWWCMWWNPKAFRKNRAPKLCIL